MAAHFSGPPQKSPTARVHACRFLTAADSLVEKVVADLHERWRKGERPRAEIYLERHPELARDPEAALEVVYAELCLQQEGSADAEAIRRDFLERFPEWRRQLEVLLD